MDGDCVRVVNVQGINEKVLWNRVITGVKITGLTIILEYDPAHLVG